MHMLDELSAVIERALGITLATQGRLLATAVLFLFYVIVQRIARRIITRTVEDPSLRFQATKGTGYALVALALGVLARIWTQEMTGFATYLGLLSAGVAIAFQDLFVNLGGWVFIVVRRPFSIGDRIQVGTHMGDVVDIRPFRFLLLEIGNWVHADQSTGRVIHVPNGWVFKNPVANFDQAFGYIWNEIEVTVSYESNWKKAKEALERTVAEHAEHIGADAEAHIAKAAHDFHIKFSKLTPVVWVNAEDSGIKLTLRYLCKARERRSSTSEMWESILDAFAELPDVDFAYPTTRHFSQVSEGKPALAPRPLPPARRETNGPTEPTV